MSTRYLTLKQLQRAQACASYVNTFRSLFPRGKVAINERTTSALAQWANFYFLEIHILTPKQQKVYNKILGPASYAPAVNRLKDMVPGFSALARHVRDDLSNAFCTYAMRNHNRNMAHAFNVAYNSPRK